MSICKKDFLCKFLFAVSIILGIIFTTLFAFWLVPNVAAIIPYLIAHAIFHILIVSLFLAKCLFKKEDCCDDYDDEKYKKDEKGDACKCVCRLARCIILASAFSFLASLAFLLIGSVCVSLASIIIVFIGAVAFFLSILAFLSFLFCLIKTLCNRC